MASPANLVAVVENSRYPRSGMYCSIDKIDLLSPTPIGKPIAIQTDHRSREEIEAEPELSALYAMSRVLNARGHLAEDGHGDTAVHYVLPHELPPMLRDALTAVGATIDHSGRNTLEWLGPPSQDAVERADTAPTRAETAPETPRPGLLRRLFGRK